MHTLVLNASPGKAWNTAKPLKSAAEGAKRCRRYWKDDLSPIIDKIFRAGALLIGTAI